MLRTPTIGREVEPLKHEFLATSKPPLSYFCGYVRLHDGLHSVALPRASLLLNQCWYVQAHERCSAVANAGMGCRSN